MEEPRRGTRLRGPVRGAGYVIALAALVLAAGAAIAVAMVWTMA